MKSSQLFTGIACVFGVAVVACFPDPPSDNTLPVEAEFCQNYSVGTLNLINRDDNTFTPLQVQVFDAGDGTSLLGLPLTELTAAQEGCWWFELNIELSYAPGQFDPDFYRFDAVINAPMRIEDASTPQMLSFSIPLPASQVLAGYSNMRLILHGPDNSYSGFSDVQFAPATEAPATTLASCEDGWDTTRELQLGDAQSGTFVPYGPEQSAEIYYGFQGLAMITPHLRVANPDDLDSACLHVRLTNRDAGGDVLRGGFTNWIQFERDADGMLRSKGSLYNEFFESEAKLTGAPVDVEFQVIGGGGVAASRTLSVDVVNETGASE